MSTRKPRRYGQWAGRPQGTAEDATRCIVEVWPNERGPIPYQCQRKRGKGFQGLFCGGHAKLSLERQKDLAKERR